MGTQSGTSGTKEISKNYPVDSGVGDILSLVPEGYLGVKSTTEADHSEGL